MAKKTPKTSTSARTPPPLIPPLATMSLPFSSVAAYAPGLSGAGGGGEGDGGGGG